VLALRTLFFLRRMDYIEAMYVAIEFNPSAFKHDITEEENHA